MDLLSGRGRRDTNVFAGILAIWAAREFIHRSIDASNFFLADSDGCSILSSLFMRRDENVSCQLEFPMLNGDAQVTPTREKPSPGTARRDQSMETRHGWRRGRVS